MRVERLVSYLLFGIVAILVITAFYNPIETIQYVETDTYFKDAHREALLIYAAFISIPGFMFLLWSDKNNSFIAYLCWLMLASAIIICASILYLTYFVNPYDMGFDDYTTYSWYIAYALIALIILNIIYLVAKIFKVGKD
ncbi:hypothetical protein [Nonlabens ulvanivorans]|uniref:Uncharacterized protein n=1 Tax=Nonlabens ulvanivorans TaxID=906888 RepID=A0A084JWE9_NONUL|nr:hypothetical protein [Nonlabens ulvanivorans]KEZ93283.1 hypothetical protein IL45_14295 [Nonlabens ulvanivorans]PRX13593.1 hypothetical protein LY02_01837 [Nonlabens ulvanivorans]